jgi:hypothetical protein
MGTAQDSLADYGFTFDDEGNFTNYDTVMTSKVNAYNSAYDTYATAMAALDQ